MMPKTMAKPSPVPLPTALVVKKDQKSLAAHSLNAGTAVLNRQTDLARGRYQRGDAQRAALGHGIPGIDNEVHQHLFQADGFAPNPGKSGIEVKIQADAATQGFVPARLAVLRTISFRGSQFPARLTWWVNPSRERIMRAHRWAASSA